MRSRSRSYKISNHRKTGRRKAYMQISVAYATQVCGAYSMPIIKSGPMQRKSGPGGYLPAGVCGPFRFGVGLRPSPLSQRYKYRCLALLSSFLHIPSSHARSLSCRSVSPAYLPSLPLFFPPSSGSVPSSNLDPFMNWIGKFLR